MPKKGTNFCESKKELPKKTEMNIGPKIIKIMEAKNENSQIYLYSLYKLISKFFGLVLGRYGIKLRAIISIKIAILITSLEGGEYIPTK